jgi:Family of unknown function (DUF6364)
MDPEVAKKAKKIAHARRTNVSAFIEDLVRNASGTTARDPQSFVQKWTGKLRLRKVSRPDPRFKALKKRYHLE